jgi:2-C-methyl-D-erythritol 2,4-cyclodiphosphate synthase
VGELRFGLAFDSHRRDDERPCRIGGVLFEGEPGLAGHSDADVLCHAVADALLGAAGLGDLGEHFPDTDPRLAEMPGLELLEQTVQLVRGHELRPSACDATLLAERPAIAAHRDDIRTNLARVLGVQRDRVSVKATRPEGLGLTGDGAGCFALAVVEAT